MRSIHPGTGGVCLHRVRAIICQRDPVSTLPRSVPAV